MPKVTSISVSCSPKLWVSQYRSFNPFASVTVALAGEESPEMAVDYGVAVLRPALAAALKTEIEFLNDAYPNVSSETDTDGLLAFCMKEIGDVTKQPSFKAVSESDNGGDEGSSHEVSVSNAKKAVVKKGGGSSLFAAKPGTAGAGKPG